MTERQRIGEKTGMQISLADRKEDLRQRKKLARQDYEALLLQNAAAKDAEVTAELEERVLCADEDPFDDGGGEVAHDQAASEEPKYDEFSKRNNMDLSLVAATSMRYEVSVRGTSAICTSFLGDLINAGELPSDKRYLAVDPRKLRRARDKVLSAATERGNQQTEEDNITNVMFDSRLDQTCVNVFDMQTRRYYPGTEVQDHYTLTDGQGRFLCHLTKPSQENEEEDDELPIQAEEALEEEEEEGGEAEIYETPEDEERRLRLEKIIGADPKPAATVALMIFRWMQLHGVDQTLQFLSADSTNSNTGWRGGIMTILEKLLGKKCTWLICQLHTNELGLRHLMEELDGRTNSRTGWSGDLGKLLKKTGDMKINYDFEAIDLGPGHIELPEDVLNDLSTDQKLLYDRATAVRTGKLSREVALKKGGSLVHSRWLTFASELLLLWMSHHNLSGALLDRLRTLVSYIVSIYVPQWFSIKVRSSWIEGPRHVLTHLELMRLQAPEVQEILLPYLKTSSWYAHSEAILQTMLCSEDQSEREFAVKKILKIRGKEALGKTAPRSRKLPKLNVDATSLVDLIDWKRSHEPLLTCHLTKEEIKEFLHQPMIVPYYCGHTQPIERAVKEVTAASANVCGEERRDGWVRSRCESRTLFKRVDSKHHLIPLLQNNT